MAQTFVSVVQFVCCASIRANILVLTGRGGGVGGEASDCECFQTVATMGEKYRLFISVKKLRFFFSDVTIVVRFYGNEYKQSRAGRKLKNKNDKKEKEKIGIKTKVKK